MGSQSHTVVIQRVSPGTLTGELIVRVRSTTGNVEGELKARNPSGLPFLASEHVHIEARLNQPAYVYVLWRDAQGQVSLIYPRHDGKFGSRPADGLARETVHGPEALDEWDPMKGPSGLETILLLARRTPLPPGTDLSAVVGPLPHYHFVLSWSFPSGDWTRASRLSRFQWSPYAGSARRRRSCRPGGKCQQLVPMDRAAIVPAGLRS
jgi:hypothetical protein